MRLPRLCWSSVALLVVPAVSARDSLSGDPWQLPSLDQVMRLVALRDFNTRIVLGGTLCLGIAAGVVGTFMLLRKRSLMGDAVSHATLPGIGLAFILMVAAGGTGKYLPGLLVGAMVAGLLGMGAVLLIRQYTRIKEDAALGIVLSVSFGIGMALLGIIQKFSTGSAAGLQSFIYGKTASMLTADAILIAICALVVLLLCALLFKEFALLCFDAPFAGSQGWPVVRLDIALMAMVVAVTVIGLQAVGLILVVALLITPPAAARFWTNRLSRMVVISAAIGGVSCFVGAAASALLPRLPAGAIIVIAAALLFLLSMVFGPQQGILIRFVAHHRLSRKISRQHLLRAIYECWERDAAPEPAEASESALLTERSWNMRQLRRHLRWATRQELVVAPRPGIWRLTAKGLTEARRLVHNHRLWEIYLIAHAEVAASRVDRDADRIEHILEPELVRDLEQRLAQDYPSLQELPNPHG